jgi:iron complex outermembrane recepter protein
MFKSMNRRRAISGFAVATSAIALTVGSTAQAQEAPAPEHPAAQPNNSDGTIVVTAQRRAERLFVVPQSVTALSADDLARQGATQLRDFATSVPGLSFTTFGAGDTKVSLRGVSTGFIEISPTTAIYVDEVPYGASTSFAQGARYTPDAGLLDLERIEVLRGPQGTLYGASAIGGLIKYVTRRPVMNDAFGDVRVGAALTHDGEPSFNGSATINAPLATDRAALRATGFYSRDGGYIDNVGLNRTDANRSDSYGGRIDLLLAPAEGFDIRITGFAQNLSRDGEGTADYTFAGVPLDGELDQRRVFAEPFRRNFRLLAGTLTYDFGPATLTSISSIQSIRTRIRYDYSAQYVPLLRAFFGRNYSAVGLVEDTHTDKFTQEVRLASHEGGPLEWVLGGFYTNERSRAHQIFALFDPAGQPAPNDLYTFTSPSQFKEYAAFANITWHLTSRFDVSGGLRYAQNRQSFEQMGSGLLIGSKPLSRSSEGVLTYLANARYRFSDHAMVYARFATGYRPGGPNFAPLNPVTGLPVGPSEFNADRLTSYEVGLRAETPSRTIGIDVAAYYIDWKDFQTSAVFGGLFSAIINAAGGATVRGTEAVITARPVNGLTIVGNFAYQDAHLSAADANLKAAAGERLPGVPRFTAALNADYLFSQTGNRPSIGGTVRYVSDRHAGYKTGTGSRTQYILPEYTTVDLRAGATFGHVDFQLFVRNLFDNRGQMSAYTSIARPHVAIQQPRTIGLNATMHF